MTKFSELEAKMSPESRARSDEKAKQCSLKLALYQDLYKRLKKAVPGLDQISEVPKSPWWEPVKDTPSLLDTVVATAFNVYRDHPDAFKDHR